MNQNSQRRSPPRRLPSDVINWLQQLYAINPYPDRFQIGSMAFHCKIETLRVQNWFKNRRTSDWRRGILCRLCRYFKSPLASEELHRLYPFSRHCVIMLSIPQYFFQTNLVNDAGLTLTSNSTPYSSPQTAEVDYNGNNNAQIGSKHSIPDDFLPQPHEHQLQIPNLYPQSPYSEQSTESRQQQLPQLETISHSSPKRQNLHQRDAHSDLNSLHEVAVTEIESSSNATYDVYQTCPPWSSSQSSSIVSHNWMHSTAATTFVPIKLEEQEFAQQRSPELNIEIYGEDYLEVVYPDYMDLPNFSLPTSNVNL